MWQRKQDDRQRRDEGLSRVIIHDANSWSFEDHAALRDYFRAHELLPEHPEAMPVETIPEIAARLGRNDLDAEGRKRLLILLGHHRSLAACEALEGYLKRPHPGFERFAKFAHEEAAQHARPYRRCLQPNDPCPCASGRKFKGCCGRGLA